MVADEKLNVVLIEDALYVMYHFSLAAFKIMCLWILSFTMMYLAVDFFAFILLAIC